MPRPSAPALAVGLLAFTGLVFACTDPSAPVPDPAAPAFSFAVLGCNRVDAAETSGDASTAGSAPSTVRDSFDIAAP